MYESFTIKNFRCFKEFTFEPLRRINLIAGKNNVGKTALLEALFLHSGPRNLLLPVTLNAHRGIHKIQADAFQIWGWLFFEKATDVPFELSGTRTSGEHDVLRARLERAEGEVVLNTMEEALSTDTGQWEFIQEHEEGPDEEPYEARACVVTVGDRGDVKLKLENSVRLGTRGKFLTGRYTSAKEDADRFSDLVKTKRQDELVAPLKLIEPRLQKLAVVTTAGKPAIHADIGLKELIPLPFLGQGIEHVLRALLAISSSPGEVVLIDEIENGLHTSVLTGMMKAIAHAARENDVQIFATTHSMECIQAAHEAFEQDDEDDFLMHRLDNVDGEIRHLVYEREVLDAALTTNLEVR